MRVLAFGHLLQQNNANISFQLLLGGGNRMMFLPAHMSSLKRCGSLSACMSEFKEDCQFVSSYVNYEEM